MERVDTKCLRAARKRPSGLQTGLLTSRKSSRLICFGSPPVVEIVQTLSPPLRSLMKAISEPSGLNRGIMSHAIPFVRASASPPPMGSR